MADPILRLLQRDDDRSQFQCGEPAIDRFFQHYAGQNQFKLHLAVTWVAVIDREIVGFATVSGASVERRVLPDQRSTQRLPDYPLPVLRLARLGVDRRAQGLGIGTALLRHVLRIALAQRDALGCVGVVVDAKSSAIAFYEGLGFVPLNRIREGSVHGDPVPMFLGIRAVEEAVSEIIG